MTDAERREAAIQRMKTRLLKAEEGRQPKPRVAPNPFAFGAGATAKPKDKVEPAIVSSVLSAVTPPRPIAQPPPIPRTSDQLSQAKWSKLSENVKPQRRQESLWGNLRSGLEGVGKGVSGFFGFNKPRPPNDPGVLGTLRRGGAKNPPALPKDYDPNHAAAEAVSGKAASSNGGETVESLLKRMIVILQGIKENSSGTEETAKNAEVKGNAPSFMKQGRPPGQTSMRASPPAGPARPQPPMIGG